MGLIGGGAICCRGSAGFGAVVDSVPAAALTGSWDTFPGTARGEDGREPAGSCDVPTAIVFLTFDFAPDVLGLTALGFVEGFVSEIACNSETSAFGSNDCFAAFLVVLCFI